MKKLTTGTLSTDDTIPIITSVYQYWERPLESSEVVRFRGRIIATLFNNELLISFDDFSQIVVDLTEESPNFDIEIWLGKLAELEVIQDKDSFKVLGIREL